MKDKRLYARIALDFDENPKIQPLSPEAFRCLIEAILWSRRNLTDGFLSKRLALARWSLEHLQELCHNDDQNPSLIESQEGWKIHDFASMQDTKAEIEARTARAVSAGRKGGLAKAKQTAKQTAKQKPSKLLSKNLAETETETYNLEATPNVVASRGARSPAAPNGTRLPLDWTPPIEVWSSMRVECPNVDLEFETKQFKDYWIAKTGRDSTKRDWTATWRKWIRTASQRQPPYRNGHTIQGADLRAIENQKYKTQLFGEIE